MEKVVVSKTRNVVNGEPCAEHATDPQLSAAKDSISSNDQKVAQRFRKLKIEPPLTAPRPPSTQSDCDTEENDYDEHTAESDNEPGIGAQQYVRLNEEQHVEAVVILKNAGTENESDAMEELLKSNGKLKFNLTPEQLGGIAGGGTTVIENKSIPRKSSLRRNSVFSNQSDLEKQLVMEKPKPIPEPAGMYDVPRRILMPMFCEDQDFMDMNSFYDRNTQLKFDEILTVYDQFPMDFLPSKYKCGACKKLCHEPRVLDCLHTFCKRCLIELEANSNSGSNLFWRRINECANFDWDSKAKSCDFEANTTADESGENEKFPAAAASTHEPSRAVNCAANHDAFSGESRFDQIRASFQNFKEKNCLKSPSKERAKEKPKLSVKMDQEKDLICPSCDMATVLPLGGVNRLPPHFVMARKIEDIVSACGNPPPNVFCELCSSEVTATSSCSTCSLKLCNFCKEAHQRQRNTSTHMVRSLGELLKKSRRSDPEARSIKCPMHPEHQLKLFCTTCHQVICNECTVFIHRDHKYTSASKAAKVYSKFVKNAIEQTKPLEDYAMQSVGRLNDMSIRINSKCESVQRDVEGYIDEYIAALEDHRKMLLKQIGEVREAKMAMIMAQKVDLEQRSQNARTAIDFAEEIINEGNEIENLIFVSILLKRFEQCLRSNRALDFKVTDTLEFLPDEMTPCCRLQNRIPLYGIITTQKADPRKCSLENSAELGCLKVHRKVELSLVTKDYEGRPMNHGGITVQTDLRYREDESRPISLNVVDNRNGTYGLSFVPERAGVMSLMVSVDGKLIEGCPYVLRIHNLRPHYGVYHCCTFCSSNGSKYSTCACGSIMPGGYRGCGHGHEGHPGQRHWSCCGSLLEYSDCTVKKAK
ncbi:E3 ubiquitin-protein ligase TRIM45 [Aedes albopictus]|uniref:B box-type domain-containing protein n=1 Tax=Aedes albopictus TaxID=7160 RepID=A0ABM1YGK7_AEDAL|nr:tripartite motif-containing protein 45 [Aedes albopictus]